MAAAAFPIGCRGGLARPSKPKQQEAEVDLRAFSRPDLAIGLFCALSLALATEYGWLGVYGPSGQIEVAAVVLYAMSVWLAVKNSILTWPVGIVATGLYVYLFYDWELYADAGLQLVYIAFSVAGLWAWWRRGEQSEVAEADRATPLVLTGVLAAVAAATVVIREYLIAVDGAAPFWDAFLTAGSLGALYLLVRKRIETWAMWAVLDVAYVVLFVSRELYLTAALYAVLLAMVIRAAREWRELLPPARVAEARA
jgi:nicotinamide mononucleotide transporter